MRFSRIILSGCLLVISCFGQATAVNPFTENFNAANTQWTVSSGDGTAMIYNFTGSSGLSFSATSTGLAYAPWTAGSSAFFLSGRLNISNAAQNGATQPQTLFGISTGIPGSMSSSDSSVILCLTRLGIFLGARSGELAGSGGAFQGTALNSVIIPWPQGSTGASIPTQWNWWFAISRNGSNVETINIYTDEYQGGSVAFGSWSWTMTSHASDSLQYVVASNTATNLTGGFSITGIIGDLHGYSSVSSGAPHAITSVVPSGGATTFQSGNQATITGTGFDASSNYTVAVGAGSTYQTVTASYVSVTTLTVALPTETNAALPYQFHVIRNNIDAELMGGITYSAPVLNAIAPHEVPVTPANSADGTVQLFGQGFDNTCTVTFAGTSGTVSVISPLQLSVIVPAGSAGMPRIILTCNSSTVYDSNTSGTYPPSGKVNFGYAPHPYLQFTTGSPTSNSPTLASLQAKTTDPAFANYVLPLNRNIATPPATDSYCSPNACWSASQQQNWWDYCWHFLFFQDSPSQATCQSEIGPQALVYIAWSSTTSGSVDQTFSTFTWAQDACLFYDAFFPSLTPAQRTSYLAMIDSVTSTSHYLRATFDANSTVAGGSYSNRIAVTNGAGGQCALAEAFSLAATQGYTTATPWIATSATTEATNAVTQFVTSANSYGNNEWMADGGCVEGSQYCPFGGTYYVLFGRALINTNAALGNASGDQGMFGANIKNARNYWRATWGEFPFFTFNDTQPQLYSVAMMADFCDRFSQADLCFLADSIQGALANANNGYIGQLNFQASRGVEDAPYSLIWRSSTTGVFQPFGKISSLANVSYATLRSSGDYSPDFAIGIKGCSNHECGSAGQHFQSDQGSIDVQAYGDLPIIDPGYFIDAAAQHSRISVAASFGLSGGTASIDGSVQFSAGAWNCATVDASVTYAAVATVLRRNPCMYANGAGRRIAVVLDDVQPVGGAATITYWQTGYATSGVSSAGFTTTGPRAALKATVFGPASTISSATGNLQCSDASVSPSWVYCELQANGISYHTVQDAYTASASQPRVTCLAPAPIGTTPMTCAVSYGSGTLTVTLSDGSTITATNGSGNWVWGSSTTN